MGIWILTVWTRFNEQKNAVEKLENFGNLNKDLEKKIVKLQRKAESQRLEHSGVIQKQMYSCLLPIFLIFKFTVRE